MESCWEYWCCGQEDTERCPAYKLKMGKECWLLAKDFSPLVKRDFKYCWQCPWYNKLTQKKPKVNLP